MCLCTSRAVHHFNDCTGLSPYISKSGRFGDGSWQCGRASDWTGGCAKLTLDDGAVVVRFGAGQSPYYVSAVRECVWFAGCTGVSSDVRLSCLTSETALGAAEVEEFSCLTQSLSLSRAHAPTHTHTHTHTNTKRPCHWGQRWSISPELFVTFPPSCCTSHLLCTRSS